ncbi:MAG: histidine phosphatase family protein, partial [Aquiluna sp.]
MTETTLGLFRHGQTDWNIDLRLQGTADIPMNAVGIEQVERAAEKIAEEHWDLVLSSPLGRARHSAELIAQRLGIDEVAIEEQLMERAFGIGEGMLYSEWHERYSRLDEIPGAESKASIEERSRKLLEHAAESFVGKKVLAVSHG